MVDLVMFMGMNVDVYTDKDTDEDSDVIMGASKEGAKVEDIKIVLIPIAI